MMMLKKEALAEVQEIKNKAEKDTKQVKLDLEKKARKEKIIKDF